MIILLYWHDDDALGVNALFGFHHGERSAAQPACTRNSIKLFFIMCDASGMQTPSHHLGFLTYKLASHDVK